MKPERLASMRSDAVSFDCESHLIQPGLLASPIVCASMAQWDFKQDKIVGKLLDVEAAWNCFLNLLDGDYTIVGANVAYDFGVMAAEAVKRGVDLMPKIFAAYEAGRVFDLQIAQALDAIANGYLGKDPRTGSPDNAEPLKDPETKKQGRYSLAIVTDLVLGRRDAKINDRFRMSYALLEGVPMEAWPPEARHYPVDDAVNTLEVALAQAGLVERYGDHVWVKSDDRCEICGIEISFGELPPCKRRKFQNENLHDLARQTYAAFAMHLGAMWGLNVDPVAVHQLEVKTTTARELEQSRFLESGLLRDRKGEISKDTAMIKRRVAVAYGCDQPCDLCAGSGLVPSTSAKSKNLIGCKQCSATGYRLDTAPVPRTATDGVQTSRDTLSESGDELLMDFASYLEQSKLEDVYIPYLKKGLTNE